jgi:hypothetical protein
METLPLEDTAAHWMIETAHVRGKLVLRSPNLRADPRLFAPNSDNGNLIVKSGECSTIAVLPGIPAATRNERYARECQIEEVSAVAP